MKKIRPIVFETNSSSTHSLVIHKFNQTNNEIPRNAELDICKELKSLSNNLIVGEMYKLRYLVSLIALHLEEESYDGYFGKDANSYWGEKAQEGWEKYQDEIMKYPWITWLCDIVKEECNTTLIFNPCYSEFPYISDFTYFEDETTWRLLGLCKSEIYNEDRVKSVFRNIIFNPSIVLEDRVDEY